MSDTHSRQILASSENSNWRTPKWLGQALHREFGFVLDAAATADDRICDLPFLGPGSQWLEDGVCGVSWWDVAGAIHYQSELERRAIFVNPPYSLKRYSESIKAGTPDRSMLIETWAEQAANDGMRGTVVGVLPYSPQTDWWRSYVESPNPKHRAVEIRRFPFRLQFEPPPDYTPKAREDGTPGKASGANVNSAIVVWSPLAQEFGEPWQPPSRYWVPAEYHARNRGRGKAQQGHRGPHEGGA